MSNWWAGERHPAGEIKNESFALCPFAAVVVIAGLALAQSALKQSASRDAAREKLIGAWHLAHIDAPGPDRKTPNTPQPQEMLIYTSDGHMSVRLATHTVTHHVQGSITRDRLVGKDLPRVFQFTDDGKLLIRSARPDEGWSVTWEHY